MTSMYFHSINTSRLECAFWIDTLNMKCFHELYSLYEVHAVYVSSLHWHRLNSKIWFLFHSIVQWILHRPPPHFIMRALFGMKQHWKGLLMHFFVGLFLYTPIVGVLRLRNCSHGCFRTYCACSNLTAK